MRLGVDISTYFEELEHGAEYFRDGKKVDPIDLFRANGVDCIRIRLWTDPQSEDGEPYLGGNCDLQNFFRLADLAKEKGFSILLDFHYSDFWADPSKQTVPKSWRGLTFEQMEKKVYDYTVEVLRAARERNIDISMIQVGNEITNGMLWPFGRLTEHPDGSRSNYENLIRLIRAGCRGCCEVYPDARIILHLERSYDQAVYHEFFSHMVEAEVDFDSIGFSYYPYWHGTFAQFFANADMCKKFGKQLIVVEVGYAFTLEDYIENEHGGAGLVVSKDNVASFAFREEYPISEKGQALFIKRFLELAGEHGFDAVFWWEPLWIPGEGICWASKAGQAYIGESGKPTRNEWANQCLFDYSGNLLEAFDAFRCDKITGSNCS